MSTAEQLAAHPRWRWMPGMLDDRGARLLAELNKGWDVVVDSPHSLTTDHTMCYEPTVPDLSDPATQGCLWAMLCEDAEENDSERWLVEWRGQDGVFITDIDTFDGSARVTGAMPVPEALLWLWGRLDG